DEPRVEVDIRVELARDEEIVLERDPLQLERNLELRVEAGLGEDVVGDALDERRARVVVLVNAVTEADQQALAVLHTLDELRYPLDGPDLVEHPQHRLVRTTVQRTVERCDPG